MRVRVVGNRAVRRKIILCILSVVVLASLAGCAAAPSDLLFDLTGEEDLPRQISGLGQLVENLLHPSPQMAVDTPVANVGVNPFGINTFLEQEVEEWKREESLRMISEAGFHWIRQEFPWEDIEIHGKGDFEDRRHEPYRSAWDKYDNIVNLAEQYDVGIIARLSNPPAWTRIDGDACGTYAPPDDLADWGDYVETIVSRYQGKIRYYQLWNEPNIYPEWGEQPVDPEAYVQLLCEGYARAKAVDPDVVILSGALAPTVSQNPGPGPALGLNEFIFLQRMYDAGAAACFDVLAVNDYMLWSGPTDRRMKPLNINFSRPMYVRDIMVKNGDAEKPIWISEMNSNAVPNDPSIEGWGAFGQVTLEQQAEYAVRAYERVMKEWPWVGVVNFWFFKRASDAEMNQVWYYFRMVEPDFTPLPVYDAMKNYATGVIPTLYVGVHQEDHWALYYDGAWERIADPSASLGAYYRALGPGATLQWMFEGTSLTLIPGPGRGEIEVQIDGKAPQRIALEGQPVRLLRQPMSKRHTVTVTALSVDADIDALVVGGTWNPSPRVMVGVAVLVVLVAWTLAPRRRRRQR